MMIKQMFCVAAVIAIFAGCKSRETSAREVFSKEKSCPLDQVTAKDRPDLSAHDLTFKIKPVPEPEIAQNPQRLAIWQQQQKDSRAQWDTAMGVVEVQGCGESAMATCTRTTKRVSCTLRR